MEDQQTVPSTISLPLAVLSGLIIVLLAVLTVILAQQFDQASRAREEALVAEGVRARSKEIADQLRPVAVWDDAVRYLDHRLDTRWALDNLSVYFADVAGVEGIFTVSRDDRPLFVSHGKTLVSPDRYDGFQPAFRQLIAEVRAKEGRRGPLPRVRPAGGLLSKPIQAQRIIGLEGRAFIAIGTLVAPDFGRHLPLSDRAPIVIAIIPVDQPFLATLANRFLLMAPRLEPGLPADRDRGRILLDGYDGRPVAAISWQPQRPGYELLKRLAPPLTLIAVLLLAALLLAYRRSRAMADGLVTSEMRATHMALHDSLTGLANRVLFLDRLRQGLARLERHGGSVVVHCIDLDRFKEINDTLGHLVGDELLRAAAARMAGQCRSSDTFARLSGDEFAILQLDASEADAASLAERICRIMAEPFELGEGRVFSGCSIGVAWTDRPMLDSSELLRQADLALYRSKSDGRGDYCLFEQAMDSAAKRRRALEEDLREALAAGALDLFYQPQVDGRGVITGVEALLRWNHPERGEVSPGLFVPIAEQSGLIMELGMFALRRAFEDSRRWQGLRVGINISANQLRSVGFVDDVRQMVEECGVDPAGFELEITEGVLLIDDPSTVARLLALREMGFSLVLDDFGTGFSSLSYLQKFPIDKIKIDRSFIANLGLEAEPEELVLAIVRLARALKLSVIAEGVESLGQWTWLRSIGCADSQGYFFRPALPGDQIDALWDARDLGLWGTGEPGRQFG